MFAEVRPNFGRIVTCCRAEHSAEFFGVCRTSAHLYFTVTPSLQSLQLLKIKERIDYKILSLTKSKDRLFIKEYLTN